MRDPGNEVEAGWLFVVEASWWKRLVVEGECFLCCSLDCTVNNFIVSEYTVVERPIAVIQ